MASPALARGVPENLTIRTLIVPQAPGTDGPFSIYVSGQVVTSLRFEAEVDPAKTRLIGWEGRFEPLLIGGKKVVLEPLHDLGTEEALPLRVTLVDGTEYTFIVTGRRHEETSWVDVQLNVFSFHDIYDAVLSQLYDSQKRERALREENERLKEQVISVDSALAMVLLNGEVKKTAFRPSGTLRRKNEEMEITIHFFKGPGKAGAVLELTNTHLGSLWRFDDAYLTRNLARLSARPFALRMDQPVIFPGESGKMGIVVDKSAFEAEGGQLTDVVLHVFGIDGVQRAEVVIDHKLVEK